MSKDKYQHRVRIQRLTDAQDSTGQPSQQWSDVATVWAEISLQSGVELVRANAEQAIVKANIRIRWRTGVTTAMRALCGGAAYNILTVLPDMSRREHVDLVCEVIA